jgi:putative acyl-CoA dehydrogenase
MRTKTSRLATNQPPPLPNHDAIRSDPGLVSAISRYAGKTTVDDLGHLGAAAGSQQAREHGRLANTNPPLVRTHDRLGNRVDEVDFHPSWHWLLGRGVGFGLQAAAWTSATPHPHLTRAAGFYAWSQVEAGHGCPLSMTYACVPALRTDPVLFAEWTPRLASTEYDPGLRPAAAKSGVLAGMAMTESQGGSDVRSNQTVAVPTGVQGEYVLTGHKWFCSAPMNDVFLVLAQAAGGLTCFLAPRVLPDGKRNSFAIQRLKDKLGNRSNASAEVEFDQTWAQRLGEEGRGVPTIIEMVAATRLDCVLGSAALMRRALAEAVWHASHRQAFGTLLVDKPLMANVLADLALESEAATALAMRLAAAVDRPDDAQERSLRRIGLPLAKFWVCKRAPFMIVEALECLGGNGYVEESAMPLLFRESPLNSIWEGSGNLNVLDLLRVLDRHPEAVEAWMAEVGETRGADRALDAAIEDVLTSLADLSDLEHRARRLAGAMAQCLQGALLVRYGPPEIADAWCAARLGGDWAGVFGTLSRDVPCMRILSRGFPRA